MWTSGQPLTGGHPCDAEAKSDPGDPALVGAGIIQSPLSPHPPSIPPSFLPSSPPPFPPFTVFLLNKQLRTIYRTGLPLRHPDKFTQLYGAKLRATEAAAVMARVRPGIIHAIWSD